MSSEGRAGAHGATNERVVGIQGLRDMAESVLARFASSDQC